MPQFGAITDASLQSAEIRSKSLATTGAIFLTGIVGPSDVAKCKSNLSRLLTANEHEFVSETSHGRLHVNLMRLSHAERAWYENLAKPLAPLVDEYFGPGEMVPELSQLQFVHSAEGSSSQIFHVDNTAKSLTILIPLVDITPSNGPTELILGTHAIFPSNHTSIWPWSWPLLFSSAAGLSFAVACCPCGGAIIYDSRTIHRGLGNGSAGVISEPSGVSQSAPMPRPVLILRYDRRETPAPGVRLAGTLLIRALAFALTYSTPTGFRFN
jgi:hypothetical protein